MSRSVKTTQTPPASVMDRVGSGAQRKGTGNMAVDDGINDSDEIGKRGLNDKAPVEGGGGGLEGAKAC